MWYKPITPVVDTSAYINEIHYEVGNRLYIENADWWGARKKRYRAREYSWKFNDCRIPSRKTEN